MKKLTVGIILFAAICILYTSEAFAAKISVSFDTYDISYVPEKNNLNLNFDIRVESREKLTIQTYLLLNNYDKENFIGKITPPSDSKLDSYVCTGMTQNGNENYPVRFREQEHPGYISYFDACDWLGYAKYSRPSISKMLSTGHLTLTVENIQRGVTGFIFVANTESGEYSVIWEESDLQKYLVAPEYSGVLTIKALVPADSFSEKRGYPCLRFVINGENKKKKYLQLIMNGETQIADGYYLLTGSVELEGNSFTVYQKSSAIYNSNQSETVAFTQSGQAAEVLFTEVLEQKDKEVFAATKLH